MPATDEVQQRVAPSSSALISLLLLSDGRLNREELVIEKERVYLFIVIYANFRHVSDIQSMCINDRMIAKVFEHIHSSETFTTNIR